MTSQKPILLDLPMPITTKRLVIRPMMPGDGKAVSEAAAALTHYAFKHMGIKRLTILCDEENLKSRAVPERLGFALEVTGRGLIHTPHRDDLSVGCRYVRFDDKGLEEWEASW